MRVLVIGGTGFIGSFVCRDLAAQDHEVTVFHRGSVSRPLPSTVRHLFGDRSSLVEYQSGFAALAPDVVLDCILSSDAQAHALLETLRGITGRVVVLSSADVYRAHGVLHGFDAGPPQPLPIKEESELRTRLHPYAPEMLSTLTRVFPWVDREYDKIPVEQAVLGDPYFIEQCSVCRWSTVREIRCIDCFQS